MSDLTPPRSQQNTPVRPGETPAHASPSAGRAPRPPQGTGTFEPSAYRGLGTLPDRRQLQAGPLGGADKADDVDEDEDGQDYELDTDDEDERMMMMDEDEEELDLADIGGEDEDETMGEGALGHSGPGEATVAPQVQEGEGSATTPAKRTLRGKPKVGAKAASKTRRDNELYESDIVARWHAEIGDVCVKPPRQAQTSA